MDLRMDFFKLKAHVVTEKPDALIASMYPSNQIAILIKILSRTPTKFFVCEHNTMSIHSKSKSGDEKWAPLMAKLLYPFSDGVIAVSKSVKDDLVKSLSLSPEKIKTIYNPVISDYILAKAREEIIHPWFHSKDLPIILGVGRLDKQKNFPLLINAFAKVRQECPSRLMILGEGPDRSELEALVQKLGLEEDVELPGFQNNPYPYLANADVFALTSNWEGLPTVLIEAMALNTPVISTDCPGGSSEILNHGQYGELVPVNDVEEMQKALQRILTGEIQSTDTQWLNQFTVEAAGKKYLNFLKNYQF
jgi:glycosyltransferase involved in cell wall biosynthesis